MAYRRFQELAARKTLKSIAKRKPRTRLRIDLDHSQRFESEISLTYHEPAPSAITEEETFRDRVVGKLKGDFAPPEMSNQAALSRANLRAKWLSIAGYQSIFGTPEDFMDRVNNLSPQHLDSLILALYPALDERAATALRVRILSKISTSPPSTKPNTTDETNRQITAQITHRNPRDFWDVWMGKDPSVMEDMADMLGQVADSTHVRVISCLENLATHWQGGHLRVSRHPTIKNLAAEMGPRLDALPEWTINHKLVDQYSLLAYILGDDALNFPNRDEAKLTSRRAGPKVITGPQVDARGGAWGHASVHTWQAVVYLRPARKGRGQMYIDSKPYYKENQGQYWMFELISLPFLKANTRPDDWDCWIETDGFDRRDGKNSRKDTRPAAIGNAIIAAMRQLKPGLRDLGDSHIEIEYKKPLPGGLRDYFNIRAPKKR